MYSLGAAFYHMVCGRPPFAGGSRSDTMKMHASDEPKPPSEIVPGIPKALCHAIVRMLEKKQTDRYPGMEELVRDLETILLGRVPIGEPAPRVDPATVKVVKRAARPAPEPAPERSRVAQVVLVVALLAAAAGIAVLAILS